MSGLSSQKNLNIARPYGLAAFEYARDQHALPEWRAFLEAATVIVKDQKLTRLLADPEIASQLSTIFADVLAPLLDEHRKNYLRLLEQNKRLGALPEILDLFNQYFAALEKISKVRVITAIDVEDAYRQTLKQALSQRIHHDVTLDCDVDPAILGGAIIHMGDRVIDGSIRGQLTRLLQNLTG